MSTGLGRVGTFKIITLETLTVLAMLQLGVLLVKIPVLTGASMGTVLELVCRRCWRCGSCLKANTFCVLLSCDRFQGHLCLLRSADKISAGILLFILVTNANFLSLYLPRTS